MQRIFILASAVILSGLLTTPLAAQTDSVIFNFNGLNRGFGTCEGGQSSLRPRAGLLFKNNRLYGTTPGGGKANGGTIFSVTIPQAGQTGSIKQVLHSFDVGGVDGANPCSRLITGPHGGLYCTTPSGGTQEYGIVFMLTRELGRKV